MKKYLLLLILSFGYLLTIAQSNIRLNNYWGNTQFINPSSVYDKYAAVFNLAARKQWIDFPGAPVTYFAAASTYLDKYHTQLGLILYQDKIGYTSTSNANLTYAYALMLRREWQIHMGVGLNFQSLNYDISQVNLSDVFDPTAYQTLKSENRFNADVGLELTNRNFKFGVASQNVFSLFVPDSRLQTNTNFVYLKARQYSNDIINWGAGACGIQYSNIYQLELNVTSYFKVAMHSGLVDKPDLFDVGIFYRTMSEAGLIFGFNLTESIHVSYSYDNHFGGISRSSYGTNELILTYNLMKRPVCHSCWY